MNKKKSDKKLSALEASEIIGITRQGILKAIRIRKTLPAEKIGYQWTVKLSDAIYYKKHRKGKPGRPKNKEIKLPGF